MAYNPNNINGQGTMATSAPVVIASNQSAVPVTWPLTDAQIRATALPISGTVSVSGTSTVTVSNPWLTDAQLRLTAVPVSLASTTISNFPATQAVSGAFFQATQPVSIAGTVTTSALTDTQLRATAVPISGTRTNNGTTLTAGANHLTVGGNDGTNLRPLSTDTTGKLNVLGAFFQATQPVSIATMPTTPVTGTFFQATQPVSGTFFQSTQPISGTVSTGGLTDTQIRATPLTVTMVNTLALTDTQLRATAVPISLATDADTTSTGTLTAAAQTVVLTMWGKSAAAVLISGTWAGTITFEGTVDGTNWNPINAVAAATSQPQPTTTVNGLYRLTPAGLLQIRANMTAFTSGTTSIAMRASAGTGGVFVNQILPTTVTSNGVISVANSTSTVLGIGGAFVGTSEDLTEFADVRVTVFSDQVSGTDGLQIQQSTNGTNWDITDAYSIPSSTGKVFSVGVSARFFRVVYVNGAVAQTAFRLQVKYIKTYARASSVRPQDGRTNDNDMDEQLSQLMGYNGTSWDRVRATIANGIAVDVTRVRSADLWVTVTAIAGAIATLTLPAPAAGLFHFITRVELSAYTTVARVGAATPVIVTSTNLAGTPSWDFSTAAAIGTTERIIFDATAPIKSSVAATATTIVWPATASVIWKIKASYYTA